MNAANDRGECGLQAEEGRREEAVEGEEEGSGNRGSKAPECVPSGDEASDVGVDVDAERGEEGAGGPPGVLEVHEEEEGEGEEVRLSAADHPDRRTHGEAGEGKEGGIRGGRSGGLGGSIGRNRAVKWGLGGFLSCFRAELPNPDV